MSAESVDVQELVGIVGSYLLDEGATAERRRGVEAATAAREMTSLLEDRFQEESPYPSLWEQFRSEPDNAMTEFAGALEALVEADPSLALRLHVLLDEYYGGVATASRAESQDQAAVDYPGLRRSGDYSEGGTYLYGNVPSGGPLGPEGAAEVQGALGETSPEAVAPDVSELVGLFATLDQMVEEHPHTAAAAKRAVQAELSALRTDVAFGSGLLQASMIERLCTVRRLSGSLGDAIIRVLIGPRGDPFPVLQNVAARMRTGQVEEMVRETETTEG